MKRRYILDAGVLALYFAGHEGAKEYIYVAYDGKASVFMCEVNVAEFLYNYARVFGWDAALVKNDLLRNSPITIVGFSSLYEWSSAHPFPPQSVGLHSS